MRPTTLLYIGTLHYPKGFPLSVFNVDEYIKNSNKINKKFSSIFSKDLIHFLFGGNALC